MTPEEASFRPVEVDFANLAEQIKQGCDKINDNGVLNVDLGQLSRCNTATICLLIELLRVAKDRQCRVNALNMQQQLNNLLALYQLSPWFAKPYPGTGAAAKPASQAAG